MQDRVLDVMSHATMSHATMSHATMSHATMSHATIKTRANHSKGAVFCAPPLGALFLTALFSFSPSAHAKDAKSPVVPLRQNSSPYAITPAPPLKLERRHLAPLQVPAIVRAPAYIVIDADSGRVLKEFSSHRRMFPASTTKTIMALTAIRHATLNEQIIVGANPPKTGEQSAYLLQGEKFTLADLLRAALVKSANDACVAIAEGVGGDVPNFAKMMNAEARRAGALDSHFVNPNGLHDPNHYTTAYDLSRIARAAMTSPFFNQIVKTREAEIHGNWKLKGNRVLVNKNRLLWMWNEADGVKTGYTRQAGRCLVASATRRVRDSDGQMRKWRLISVVMHSPDSWGESAKLLLDGFAQFRPSTVARRGQEFGEARVENGAGQVSAVAMRDLSLPLRADETVAKDRVLDVGANATNQSALSQSESSNALTSRVVLASLRAPLRRGQTVGKVEWLSRGRVLANVPLIARDDVGVSTLARVAPPLSRFAPSDTALLWLSLSALTLGAAFVLIRRTRA